MLEKNKIRLLLTLTVLFSLVCFYYEWITNLLHHVSFYFDIDSDSFLGILAVIFWGAILIVTGYVLGNSFLKNLLNEYNNIDDFISTNKSFLYIILALFVVFFLFFSSSSMHFDNYIGLKLEDIVEDEYTISGEEFLEYNEREQDVPDEIAYEILDEFDNNLFKKKQEKFIQNRLDVFGKYYEYIGFDSEEFIFEETGIFQGYNINNGKTGFFSYSKALFFSYLETLYRTIVFFLITTIPIIILISIFGKEKAVQFLGYGLFFCLGLFLLYIVYSIGESIVDWVKSLF